MMKFFLYFLMLSGIHAENVPMPIYRPGCVVARSAAGKEFFLIVPYSSANGGNAHRFRSISELCKFLPKVSKSDSVPYINNLDNTPEGFKVENIEVKIIPLGQHELEQIEAVVASGRQIFLRPNELSKLHPALRR